MEGPDKRAPRSKRVKAVDSSWEIRQGPEIRYRENSIELANVFGGDTEGRGIEEHRAAFGLTPEDFKGKRILNMGAGPSARLEREVLRALPPDSATDFFSVSPDYAKQEHRDLLNETLAQETETIRAHIHPVAAIGQLSPFKEEIFDIIILLHVLEHTNKHLRLFEELSRNLKQDGKIYFGPYITDAELLRYPRSEADITPDILGKPNLKFIRTLETKLGLRFVETKLSKRWPRNSSPKCVLYGYFAKN